MKNSNNLLRLTAVAAALACSQLAAAQGISVTDYDEATSEYQDAYVNGSFNAGKNRDDAQSSYELNLGLDYEQVFASPDRDVQLRFNGGGSVGRDGTAGASREKRYEYATSATADTYFNPATSLAFWYGSVGLKGSDAFDSRTASLFGGAGYGRVKNVTPMAKAIRVVEELQSLNRLKDAPSRAEYQAAANIVDREDEYRSKFGAADYTKEWINDIAKALDVTAKTGGQLDARDVIAIYDVLTNERISTRKVGWKVRAGLGYQSSSFNGITDNDPAVELGAEYHYPLDNLTQFSNVASLTSVLNNSSTYLLRNAMSLTYELDRRLDWENGWTMTHDVNGPSSTKSTVNTLSTGLIYELRNQLDLTGTLAVSNYSGDQSIANPNGTDTALFVGVRYRLK
ncbi:hypothetical protein LPB72_11010 [Hydrogenophaga crassostreae]|uniref:DUF481 domain-containing protein n=1 Tax=Hydrogenophaga crassostreae TaxID=1763535 RepID=A0A167HWI3_9BURK|nr:DUF481 domain-containing protein [Hydrogenophaga crassostreae]AOW13536.1 hypothetical protein LPB072_12390 [Hydrogenophaga crassostreae]OAD41827.1 hypothetical protein LPB72_11010 [Hydrogenophaga crassostreae]